MNIQDLIMQNSSTALFLLGAFGGGGVPVIRRRFNKKILLISICLVALALIAKYMGY